MDMTKVNPRINKIDTIRQIRTFTLEKFGIDCGVIAGKALMNSVCESLDSADRLVFNDLARALRACKEAGLGSIDIASVAREQGYLGVFSDSNYDTPVE